MILLAVCYPGIGGILHRHLQLIAGDEDLLTGYPCVHQIHPDRDEPRDWPVSLAYIPKESRAAQDQSSTKRNIFID